jgi:hypothetical protein
MERHLLYIRFVLAFDRPVGSVYTRAEGARSDTNAGPVCTARWALQTWERLDRYILGVVPVFLSSWGLVLINLFILSIGMEPVGYGLKMRKKVGK